MKKKQLVAFVLSIFISGGFISELTGEIKGEDLPKKLLIRGNNRFEIGHVIRPNLNPTHRTNVFQGKAKPFATIVTCSEAGISPEFIFDQGIGDLNVIRTAGYICSDDVVRSIEQSINKVNSSKIVIMGHNRCSLFSKALSNNDEKGHMGVLLKRIRMVRPKEVSDFSQADFVERSIQLIMEKSPFLRDLVKNGKLNIQGAIYDGKTKKVDWIQTDEKQREILALPDTLVRKDPWIIPEISISESNENENSESDDMDTNSGESGYTEVKARTISTTGRVIQAMKKGNLSFSAGKLDGLGWDGLNHPSLSDTKAVVLTRSSSLIPTEYVLGSKSSDIFVIRNSELSLTQSNLAGLEYGMTNLGGKVLLLLDVLEDEVPSEKDSSLGKLRELALEIEERSQSLSQLYESDKIDILLGLYNPASGLVDWHSRKISENGGETGDQTTPNTNGKESSPSLITQGQNDAKLNGLDNQTRSNENGGAEKENVISLLPFADKLLSQLKSGNKRFVADNVEQTGENKLVGVSARKHFQSTKPQISILYPSDLFIPVATIFDQKPGTFYKVNLISDKADETSVASLEIGINKLKTPLVIFLRHDLPLETEEIPALNEEKASSASTEMDNTDKKSEPDESSYPATTRQSILMSMVDTLKKSKIIREKFHNGQIDLVGAIYDTRSGVIEWVRPGSKTNTSQN